MAERAPYPRTSPVELSIVIPVYRSAGTIARLHAAIVAALDGAVSDYEMIFVEDGGGDDSWSIVRDLARQDSRVRGIKLTRNFGQHYAMTAGLAASSGEWVVTMDCDLQDDPAFLLRLLEKRNAGVDVVLVRRTGEIDSGFSRWCSRTFYRVFDWLTGFHTDPAVGTYRIMSRRVVDEYSRMPERYRFFGGMMQWMGFPTATIDLPRRARAAGRSSYTFFRRLSLAMDAVLSFSDRPLKLMVLVGAATCAVTMLYAAWIALLRIAGRIPEIGFASILISLYLLGGLLLMSTGLVGVYVGRIYHEAKHRPLYLIAEDTRRER